MIKFQTEIVAFKRAATFALFAAFSIVTAAQKLSFSGYVKDMQCFYFLEDPIFISYDKKIQWSTYNQIHNRLNINWQANENLRFEAGIRNRLLSGKLMNEIPGYSSLFEKDKGFVDMSWNIVNQDQWFLNTSIDRLFLEYTWKNFQVKAGRQRINWGINLVWNPNDLFNAFSYLDFDYEERPGSDAILFTWYSSASSSLDVAVKTDSSHNYTAAARYLFNLWDYDIQFIAGKNDNDFVAGGGWAGSIGKVSFRGEASFFKPLPGKEDISETSLSATLSADYTFSNSLYLHSAFLYNSAGKTSISEGSGISLLNPDFELSAKKLSLGRYEIFAQASYPVNPILGLNFATIYNPSDNSAYFGPAATVSLSDNLELMLTAQLLTGKKGSEYGYMGNTYACFGRLRWSF